MRLLVTRPEPGASRTRADLAARGHDAEIDPLMTIVPVALAPPDGRFDAVALTSVNGARAAAGLPWLVKSGVPVFTVGRRTGDAARAAGFADVTSAEGDVGTLADVLAKGLIAGERVLWLAGEDRSGDLAAALAPHGIAVETVIAYRAEPAEHLAETTIAALSAGRIDGILHYSRRSCETLLAAGRRDGVYEAVVRLPHYALSPRVAAPLGAVGADVRVAATPDESGLFELLPSAGGNDVRHGRTAMASNWEGAKPHESGQTPADQTASPTENTAVTIEGTVPEAAEPEMATSPDDTPAAQATPGEVADSGTSETAAQAAEAAPVVAESQAERLPADAVAVDETRPDEIPPAASNREPAAAEAPVTAAPAARATAPARGGGAVAGTIAGILAGAATAAALSYLPILPPRPSDPGPLLEAQARLQAAESRIGALEARPEPTASEPAPAKYDEIEALGHRVADLERVAQALARIDARLDALEARPQSEGAAAPQAPAEDARVSELAERITALDGRIETTAHTAEEAVKLATAAGEAAQRAASAATALPDRLATLDKKVADLAGLPGRVVALDQRIQLAAQPSRAIAWPVALGTLRTAVDEGRPYRRELDAAVALSGPGYEKLRSIDGAADKGLPTLRAVQARFGQVSSALLATVPRTGEPEGVLERLARNAEGLVRFRPSQPVDGNSTGAVVARAEDQLARGDLAGAIATVGELPPDLVKVATPWLQLAKARLDADRLLSELTAEALAALARTGG